VSTVSKKIINLPDTGAEMGYLAVEMDDDNISIEVVDGQEPMTLRCSIDEHLAITKWIIEEMRKRGVNLQGIADIYNLRRGEWIA
jgi:hypothetical protein